MGKERGETVTCLCYLLTRSLTRLHHVIPLLPRHQTIPFGVIGTRGQIGSSRSILDHHEMTILGREQMAQPVERLDHLGW